MRGRDHHARACAACGRVGATSGDRVDRPPQPLDLLGTAKLIYTETFDPITPLLLAAAIYLLLVWLLQMGLSAIEWWLMPHMRDALRAERQRNPRVLTSNQRST